MDILGLIPSFGGFLYTVAAFVVALSVIVAVHEYGHYIVGRWCGIRADVFSLGFGPVLLRRTDRRGTLWQVAALPLGGYVKFAGDANAASVGAADTPGLDPAAARETMHGAPLWARAATVAAGPAFNFALSILVFSIFLMVRGVPSDPLTVAEVSPLPAPIQQVEPGDEILAIAGQPLPPLDAMEGYVDTIPVEATLDYTVLRDGQERTVEGPFPYPPIIGAVTPQTAAADAGLKEGEVVTAVDGAPVTSFDELRRAVGEGGGAPLTLTVWAPGGDTRDVTLTPRRVDLPAAGGGFETRWLLGVTNRLFFAPASQSPGPAAALGQGVRQTVFIVQSSLSGLYNMAVGAISRCNLRGPIGIAQVSGAAAEQGGADFIWFIAVLSTAVGLMNLFPIPILDGGHLVFHAWEAVTGRPPGPRVLNVLMAMGLAMLGTLMVFALFNDLFCP